MTQQIIELRASQFPWDLLLLADPSREQVEKYIHLSTVLGLAEGDVIAAVAVLIPKDEGQVEIMNLAVEPALQSRGLGKCLLLGAINVCRERGFKRIEIGTGNSSLNQLALYQKVGFRITGIDKDYFIRNYPELIVENGIVCRDMIRLSQEL